MSECVFCKIANGEIGKLIYEDDRVVAFDDLNPQAPIHVLIIPKKHIARICDIEGSEDEALMGHCMTVAKEIAAGCGIVQDGYRLVVNCNEGAGQSVWHVHFHLLGGREMGWPPG